jgi:hypothetical protein
MPARNFSVLQTECSALGVISVCPLNAFGYANFGRNLVPSLLVATSVTSLGNAMGGINWEPIGGLDFYAGIASAHKMALPTGLAVNTAAIPGTTVTPVTQEHVGFAIGVGFDLNTITALFSAKGSAAGLP